MKPFVQTDLRSYPPKSNIKAGISTMFGQILAPIYRRVNGVIMVEQTDT